MKLEVSTVVLALAAAVCGSAAAAPAFSLSSPMIGPDRPIPTQLTCDGKGASPPLQWSDPPAGTKSLVLLVDDPDAPRGPFVHWVVYDIPPDARRTEMGRLPAGARQGLNGRHEAAWTGPCPPSGMHHYVFTLYALDTALNLQEPTAQDVHRAMYGHVLAQARMVGTYERPGR